MAHKKLLFHAAAREKLLAGTQALADAVRVTLGPRSKSVLIRKRYGAPIVCDDGVTIAREIKLEDPEQDVGAQLLKEGKEDGSHDRLAQHRADSLRAIQPQRGPC